MEYHFAKGTLIMTTLVGTQTDFKDVIIDLLELEYDAIDAYQLAIKKVTDLKCKSALDEFLLDHERHVSEIKSFYLNKFDLPKSGDLIKGIMAKMKVAIGNITGSDINILRAMLDNEKDTNTAYDRVVKHPQLPLEIKEIFVKAFQDEQKHKKWLEDYIEAYK